MDILIQFAYVVSAALFIFGLKQLGSPATARRGNMISSLGMLLAIVVAGSVGACGNAEAGGAEGEGGDAFVRVINVEVTELELGSLASVRDCARRFLATHEQLHLLGLCEECQEAAADRVGGRVVACGGDDHVVAHGGEVVERVAVDRHRCRSAARVACVALNSSKCNSPPPCVLLASRTTAFPS